MTLAILSLEDEANVREALERDLDDFWRHVRLEVADDADDAWSAVEDIVADGDELALVLSDHRLPGKSGVDFLVELVKDPRFSSTRTVLVTGQADQDDTIRALNEAGLDHYIAKPWDPVNLQEILLFFIIANRNYLFTIIISTISAYSMSKLKLMAL